MFRRPLATRAPYRGACCCVSYERWRSERVIALQEGVAFSCGRDRRSGRRAITSPLADVSLDGNNFGTRGWRHGCLPPAHSACRLICVFRGDSRVAWRLRWTCGGAGNLRRWMLHACERDMDGVQNGRSAGQRNVLRNSLLCGQALRFQPSGRLLTASGALRFRACFWLAATRGALLTWHTLMFSCRRRWRLGVLFASLQPLNSMKKHTAFARAAALSNRRQGGAASLESLLPSPPASRINN